MVNRNLVFYYSIAENEFRETNYAPGRRILEVVPRFGALHLSLDTRGLGGLSCGLYSTHNFRGSPFNVGHPIISAHHVTGDDFYFVVRDGVGRNSTKLALNKSNGLVPKQLLDFRDTHGYRVHVDEGSVILGSDNAVYVLRATL